MCLRSIVFVITFIVQYLVTLPIAITFLLIYFIIATPVRYFGHSHFGVANLQSHQNLELRFSNVRNRENIVSSESAAHTTAFIVSN